jgi:hypothetical protein
VAAFLVERYLSSATAEQLAVDSARTSQIAEELTAAGLPVAYLGTVFLPPDQSCLALFDAAAPEHVREACRRANIPCDRVTSALLAGLPASPPDPARRGPRESA